MGECGEVLSSGRNFVDPRVVPLSGDKASVCERAVGRFPLLVRVGIQVE
jgi:hypothetical protein